MAAAAAGGKARIVVYSINSDGPDFRVILTGAVGDYGPAVTVHPDGKVDPRHTSEMELKLTARFLTSHAVAESGPDALGTRFVSVLPRLTPRPHRAPPGSPAMPPGRAST